MDSSSKDQIAKKKRGIQEEAAAATEEEEVEKEGGRNIGGILVKISFVHQSNNKKKTRYMKRGGKIIMRKRWKNKINRNSIKYK